MPTAPGNIITQGWSGTLTKQVVFRQRAGKTIICNYPQFGEWKPTEKQKLINNRMEEANDYAKETIANEQLRNEAQVRLNVTRNKLYTSLVSEYFKKFREEEANGGANPALPSAEAANRSFVDYLLKNTSQTPEQIAALAMVSVDFVKDIMKS